MSESTTVVAVPSDRTTNFDWGAIIGGALIAAALSFVLFSFGSAAGVAAVSPYSWNNPSTTTITILAAAWFSVVMIGSFLVGGYFTGRFRRPAGATSVEERQSRDGAHGLVMWAIALLVGLGMAYCAAAIAASGAATVASGAAAGAAHVAGQQSVTSGLIERMLRPVNADPSAPPRRDNSVTEISRILSDSALRGGEITNPDREYIASIVAAEARLPPEEARKRVDSTIERAKQAVDKARKVAAGLAFMIGALSMIAAGAAFWAAGVGGREREENFWRK